MKINKNRESHEYEQNLKKSWKWIKAGKVMNEQNLKSMKMNKTGKVMNEQNLKSHENE